MVLMAKWQVTVISPLDTAVIVIIPISTTITSQYSLCWGLRIKGKAKKKNISINFWNTFCTWLYRVVVMGWWSSVSMPLQRCNCLIYVVAKIMKVYSMTDELK